MPDEWIILPSDFATQLILQIYQSTHLGGKKIQDLLRGEHIKVLYLKSKVSETMG